MNVYIGALISVVYLTINMHISIIIVIHRVTHKCLYTYKLISFF